MFRVGDKVSVNGKRGQVTSVSGSLNMYGVSFDDGSSKMVKGENMNLLDRRGPASTGGSGHAESFSEPHPPGIRRSRLQ